MKRIHLVYPDDEFIELQLIKNNSGLSWDRFVAECIRRYGDDKQ